MTESVNRVAHATSPNRADFERAVFATAADLA
jgi:hypothetical protein